MKLGRPLAAMVAVVTLTAGLLAQSTGAALPRVTLTPAPILHLPGTVDSNSPVMWDLEEGERRLFVMTSFDGAPRLSAGASMATMSATSEVSLYPHPGYGVWMEAVVSDDVETWYGYYHNEWPATACGRDDRMIARIGAARSQDRGRTWQDLGPVIQAMQSATACASPNRYIIGGVGDFSVMLDDEREYLYIFYSQYQREPSAQGVAVARSQWADRDRPSGRIELWRSNVWEPMAGRREVLPSLPGQLRRRLEWTYPAATPLVPATLAWHDADERVDAFWGPSVHWNTALQQYVMLLNRSKDETYSQEGIYVSFAPRLDDPRLWSAPTKIMNGGKWYPQVVGAAPGAGTDKLAGATARFYMSGRSDWFISFSR
jgi:hypothetical protein